MAMIEQNISGVKLERLRKKAHRRTKILVGLRLGVFGGGAFLTLALCGYDVVKILPETGPGTWVLGLLGMAAGGLLLSFCLSLMVFFLYQQLFWTKPYDFFCQNYKNKYVLVKLRERPGFSALKYFQNRGFSFQELSGTGLLPLKGLSFFESKDYWEGTCGQVRFRAAHVEVGDPEQNAVPLFQGQVMVFSLFHAFKVSESAIQVFPRQMAGKRTGHILPNRVELEHEAFHQKFFVFAEDAHNAFYILTPQTMEDLIAFADQVHGDPFFVFSGPFLYVGCEQMRNPFDAVVDTPLEEQNKTILLAADLVQIARDILVRLEQDRGRTAAIGECSDPFHE